MRKAVLFDVFSGVCQYRNAKVFGGYGCNHPAQEETDEAAGKETGRCFCFSCPLGTEAEQCDLTDNGDIDWDGLCGDGEVCENEYLIVDVGEMATEEQRTAMYSYELYMHRYDKEWLDNHGIPNALV